MNDSGVGMEDEEVALVKTIAEHDPSTGEDVAVAGPPPPPMDGDGGGDGGGGGGEGAIAGWV